MRSRLTLVWSSIGGVRPPNSQLQNASMSTRISVPSPPESLVNNKFTKKLRKLYAKKLNSGEILPEPIKTHSADITHAKPIQARFKSEAQLYNHVISTIQGFTTYLQLSEFISQIEPDVLRFPNSSLSLLVQWRRQNVNNEADYETLNHIFKSMSVQEHDFNSLYLEKLMKLYLCVFQMNHLPLNVIYLNLIWVHHGTPELYDAYVLTYLLILYNSGQKQLSINQLIRHLTVNQGKAVSFMKNLPDIFILHMLETRDFERLHFIMSQFKAYNLRVDDHLWISILLSGLHYNNYEIVNFVYKNYIMKDFSSGKFTIDDAVLSQNTIDSNSVFGTFTDTLILQILHTISMSGDIKSTEDLIKGHFVYKALSNETKALSKELCINIIESYCYNIPDETTVDASYGDESIKRILDLINVFVNQTNLSSVDLFECMNFKFKNWKADTRELDSNTNIVFEEENEETIPMFYGNTNIHNSKYGVVLANLSNLNEFINVHVNYMNNGNFNTKTQTIFINCLLNHMVVFLNHTGLVSVLKNLHFLHGVEFVNYLDQESWKLILQSVSLSTSKMCARFYFDYMKNHGIEVTPRFYSCLIKASLNGDDYYGDVIFYVEQCLKDHGELNHDMQRVLDIVTNNNSKIKELITNLQEPGEELVSTVNPAIKRQYLERYDLNELEVLERVFV